VYKELQFREAPRQVSVYLPHLCIKCYFIYWKNVKLGKPTYIPLKRCKEENNFIPVLSHKTV